jgi:hypothetical protein
MPDLTMLPSVQWQSPLLLITFIFCTAFAQRPTSNTKSCVYAAPSGRDIRIYRITKHLIIK